MRGFGPDDLVACYRRGVFPMADARRDKRLFLVDPVRRGVLPLDRLRVPRRLARTVRSQSFEMRVDSAFGEVIRACAAPGPGRMETWINFAIEDLCVRLFERGEAHSVEAWRDGRLVGGLYGIAVGGAFFGESMFSQERDASKVALVHLVGRLRAGGFALLDTQFVTDHLAGLGAEEIDRIEYRRLLADAVDLDADFWRAASPLAGADALALACGGVEADQAAGGGPEPAGAQPSSQAS
ncbi:MAG TPA: leucyl/phenylalanyl-tRNA--protein transferase [Caulobacteraceae bacterium]|nr:leucyl/phenylalanyl-tRNA--protein transferase [Caulobacteraceae bacterium]